MTITRLLILSVVCLSGFCTAYAGTAQLRCVTISAGTARLDNGSIVNIGEPLVGIMSSSAGGVSVTAGILPVLELVPNTQSVPPTLSPGGWQPGGAFGLHFATQIGRNYVVEASTNLTTWAPVATNTGNGNAQLFLDSSSTLFPKRFYRVTTW